ncbi:MAG: DUF2288 family protein [Polyangiaceae bacterium]
MTSKREALEASLGPVHFSDLRTHVTRGVVIVVANELDLLDVGLAVAEDAKETVEAWISTGALRKPGLADLERWSKVEGAGWNSLVVAPFVLVQDVAARTPSHPAAN